MFPYYFKTFCLFFIPVPRVCTQPFFFSCSEQSYSEGNNSAIISSIHVEEETSKHKTLQGEACVVTKSKMVPSNPARVK